MQLGKSTTPVMRLFVFQSVENVQAPYTEPLARTIK